MQFIIKVPGVGTFRNAHPHVQAAIDWAFETYPNAHPASVRCLRGEKDMP